MSESLEHIELVGLLRDYFHSRDDRRSHVEYSDEPSFIGEAKPQPIGGYRPDIVWKTAANEYRFIGEAKTLKDLYTDHSRAQLSAYFNELEYQDVNGLLVVAVPFGGEAVAKGVLELLANGYTMASNSYKVISPAIKMGYGD